MQTLSNHCFCSEEHDRRLEAKKGSKAEAEQCLPALLSKNRPVKCKHIEILIKVTDPYQIPSEIHKS